MIRLGAAAGSLFVIATLIVGSLGVVATTGCSGTCSADETKKCDDKFSACTTAAATAASKPQCEQCATSYCECYDDCGSECNADDHKGTCAQIP